MGRPPSNGAPSFRFSPVEVAQMEALLTKHEGQVPPRDLLVALAQRFSNSPDRAGKTVVQMKQVWNWFQNRRYALRAKSTESPGKPTPSPVTRDDVTPVRNVPPVPRQMAVSSGPHVVRNVSEAPIMEFEAKSARDGAWYDVQLFLSHRYLDTANPEVLVRFAGFGPEEDEWVNILKHVRQRSLPCEASECIVVNPGDLILCFQEGKEQALYFDAHVLDAQRRRHDVRGCRCRFLVRYDHDHSEEIVPLRKICRRPETDYRLQQLHAANEASASASTSTSTSVPMNHPTPVTDLTSTSTSGLTILNPRNPPITVSPLQPVPIASAGPSVRPPAPTFAPISAPAPPLVRVPVPSPVAPAAPTLFSTSGLPPSGTASSVPFSPGSFSVSAPNSRPVNVVAETRNLVPDQKKAESYDPARIPVSGPEKVGSDNPMQIPVPNLIKVESDTPASIPVSDQNKPESDNPAQNPVPNLKKVDIDHSAQIPVPDQKNADNSNPAQNPVPDLKKVDIDHSAQIPVPDRNNTENSNPPQIPAPDEKAECENPGQIALPEQMEVESDIASQVVVPDQKNIESNNPAQTSVPEQMEIDSDSPALTLVPDQKNIENDSPAQMSLPEQMEVESDRPAQILAPDQKNIENNNPAQMSVPELMEVASDSPAQILVPDPKKVESDNHTQVPVPSPKKVEIDYPTQIPVAALEKVESVDQAQGPVPMSEKVEIDNPAQNQVPAQEKESENPAQVPEPAPDADIDNLGQIPVPSLEKVESDDPSHVSVPEPEKSENVTFVSVADLEKGESDIPGSARDPNEFQSLNLGKLDSQSGAEPNITNSGEVTQIREAKLEENVEPETLSSTGINGSEAQLSEDAHYSTEIGSTVSGNTESTVPTEEMKE